MRVCDIVAADVSAHRAAITERDSEVLNHKQRADKAESTLRNVCWTSLVHFHSFLLFFVDANGA